MSQSTPPGLESPAPTDCTDLDDRDVRALTERMGVLPDDGDDLFRVVGQNEGGEYTVDAREGRCTCPDAKYREPEGGCKHVRRVRFATGKRAVPAEVDRDAVDDLLGAHLPDGGPRFAATDGGIVDAGDEGVVLEGGDDDDAPAITTHVEPPRQGGETYLRCEGCGREIIGTDERRLRHADDCSRREYQ